MNRVIKSSEFRACEINLNALKFEIRSDPQREVARLLGATKYSHISEGTYAFIAKAEDTVASTAHLIDQGDLHYSYVVQRPR